MYATRRRRRPFHDNRPLKTFHHRRSVRPQKEKCEITILKARQPTRRLLSGTLGAWVASPDSVSADLHGDCFGSNRVGVDQRLWLLLAAVRAEVIHHLGVIWSKV